MYSDDLRWRVVSLIHNYGIEADFLSGIFGPNPRSIHRWYRKFLKTGTVRDNLPVLRQSRWPREVIAEVEKYVKAHPTFYIEELKDHLRSQYPRLRNTSDSTICRVLNFDLQLSRKTNKSCKRICSRRNLDFKKKLRPICSYPEQLVFVDETSKDG